MWHQFDRSTLGFANHWLVLGNATTIVLRSLYNTRSRFRSVEIFSWFRFHESDRGWILPAHAEVHTRLGPKSMDCDSPSSVEGQFCTAPMRRRTRWWKNEELLGDGEDGLAVLEKDTIYIPRDPHIPS